MLTPMTTGVISARVERLRLGDDPQTLARLASGWAILGDRQPGAIAGSCVLMPDPVVASVNDLDAEARGVFLTDLVRLGDAILAATGAERVNYLILCNQAPELHAHAIPRFSSEDPAKRRLGPFEAYDFPNARAPEPEGLDRELIRRLRASLRA